MQLRRILSMAAVGAILIWIFFGRPIHRRMHYADVIRRATEDKCCGPGSARYPTLCRAAIAELEDLARGREPAAMRVRARQ